ICYALKWDAWPVTRVDYDLFIVNQNTVLADSTTDQLDGPAPPVEEACWTNATASPVPVVPAVYEYAATLFTGRVDIFAVGSDAGVTDSPGSVVEPASAPAAVAVGAQCWSNLFLDRPYSSRGPTIDGRPEPALLAPDGVSTATYGPPGPCF